MGPNKKYPNRAPHPNRAPQPNRAPKSRLIPMDVSDLTPFAKNFYEDSQIVKIRSKDEIQLYRDAKKINILGEAPNPIQTFTDYMMPPYICQGIENLGFSEPTPIQAQAWPIALSGKDMVGIARTGSGKTLAFVLPAIVHIKNQPILAGGDGPIALVVAPTRELALQILKMADEFSKYTKLRSVCVYGGKPKGPQIVKLSKTPQLVIATPGRLIDFLRTENISLKRCTYLVLDEADRLLDMGFEPQLKEIIHHIRPDRQTLMFSATWPNEVRSLAKSFMQDFVRINIGSMELAANHNIAQIVEICKEEEKWGKLMNLLEEATAERDYKIIIFGRTKSRVKKISKNLLKLGITVVELHGGKSQGAREKAFVAFRTGASRILIGTDCAGRGLDMDNITLVINYDYPLCSEDYVHRIGRTARSDKSGTSCTYMTTADCTLAKDLIEVLKEAKQEIPPALFQLLKLPAPKKGNRKKSNKMFIDS